MALRCWVGPIPSRPSLVAISKAAAPIGGFSDAMRMRIRAFVAITALLAGLATPAWAASRVIAWDSFQSKPLGSSLGDIVALSPNDVWAVGLRSGGRCQFQTLTEHWSGSSWSVVPSPNVDGVNSVLNGESFA